MRSSLPSDGRAGICLAAAGANDMIRPRRLDERAVVMASTPTNAKNDTTPLAVPPRRGPLSGGLGLIVVAVLLGAAAFTTYRTFSAPPPAPARPQFADCVCAKTLKHFQHRLTPGESFPVVSPHSNERSGYPAEKCYWTKDGRAKLEPTFVLLNEYLGKPGPTLCPDCGRLVEPHNPLPPSEKFPKGATQPDATAAANTQPA